MSIHQAEITKVYPNSAKYRIGKHMRSKAYNFLLLLLVPVLAVGCLRLTTQDSLKSISQTVCNLYNPIYSPYVETGQIVFTWNYDFSQSDIGFSLPIHSSDITIDSDGTVSAVVKESVIIKSVADGVVDQIADQDGTNVVKIMYGKNIFVEYINIDILGVSVGNAVSTGQEIGTAKIGETVQFKAYYNNKQVSNLIIDNNKIVWQN